MLRFGPGVGVLYFGELLAEALRAACGWSSDAQRDVCVRAIDDAGRRLHGTNRKGCELTVELLEGDNRELLSRALIHHLHDTLPPWFDVRFDGVTVFVRWSTAPGTRNAGEPS